MDIRQIDNYFFYLPEILPKNPTIVEVGSFTGKNSIKLHNEIPNSNIIIYEASKDSFNKLSEATKDFSFTLHNKAVTDKNGQIIFHEFEGAPSSSSIYSRPITQRKRRLIKQELVECTSVENILIENNIDKIDLLLLNCEGAEIPIMKEIISKPDLQKRITQLCVSFHYGRIYPKDESDRLTKKLNQSYKMLSNDNEKLEYVLFYYE